MIKKNNSLKNLSEGKSKELGDNSFFSTDTITTPCQKLKKGHYKDRVERNNLILDVIRIYYPLSKYKLSKMTGFSYTAIKQITKEFAFCGLITIKDSIGTNNRPFKLISLKEEKNG